MGVDGGAIVSLWSALLERLCDECLSSGDKAALFPMLRVMPEASHASPVRRGESRPGRPDLYLLQWAIWMGLQGALGLKVDSVSTELLYNTPEKKALLC